MLTYQCMNCGNPITVEDHERVGKCPVCGSLFVFPNQYANKENIYRLGRDALANRNFDLALTYYSRILKIDAIETEAHWGYLLSKYGVEIRMDAMHRYDVLFHRMERTLLTDDPSYARLIEYCPKEALYYYQTLAEKVAEKQRQMFKIAKNMGEFDVYVNCVAQPGTADYMVASQVNDALVNAGYQVFTPCIALEGVVEENKNLFEMAVAEKAKAMIVVVTRSTDKEEPRYQAVWKRYLAYRKLDANRKMLSIYRDILPDQDLPLELQPLQSIECAGQNFQDHVLEEINKMFGRQNRDAGLTRQILELLREGDRALVENRFRDAMSAYEQVKKLDAEEVRAHWGLVCAGTDNLKTPKLSDTLDANYKNALQFAEGAQKEEYRKIMSALMTDAAWQELLHKTGRLQDSAVEETMPVKAAIARVYLYMPKDDARLAQIERYHELCKMDREAEALQKAYRSCDVMANPLFGDHRTACEEYQAIKASNFTEMLSGTMIAILMGSLVLLSLAWVMRLYDMEEGTSFMMVVYNLVYLASYFFGVMLFFGGLMPLFYLAWFVPIIAGIVFMIFGRNYVPYAILVNLVVLIGIAIFLLLGSNSVRSAAARKKNARKKLESLEAKLEQAYRTDMAALYTKYGQADHAIAEFRMRNHADMYDEKQGNGKKGKKQRKQQEGGNPLVSAALIIVFLVAYSILLPMALNHHYAKGWTDVVDIYVSNNTVVGLRADGTVVVNGSNVNKKCEVDDWTDVVQIVAGEDYTAGLKSDGTLLLASKVESFYRSKGYFENVEVLSGSEKHLIGLKSDGTLVDTGWNGNQARDVGGYTDVKQVLAMMYKNSSDYMTVIVTGDGKVHMTPLSGWDSIREWMDLNTGSEEGQYHVEKVYGFYSGKIILVTTDGKCHAIGGIGEVEQETINSWDAAEVKEFFTGDSVLALKYDGTLLCAGDNASINTDITSWPAVEDLAGGYYHVLGLKADGTVVAAGDTTYGKCDVEGWKNVERIYAGLYNSYGITEDGHIYAAGYSNCGMTYLSNKNIVEVLLFFIDSIGW